MTCEVSAPTARVTFFDFRPDTDNMLEEVKASLGSTPKRLSPKFFYDARGSRLFDKICRLPEYYPTRTEVSIYKSSAHDMARTIGENVCLLELGSGSSEKIRLILEAVRPAMYIPLDISREHLLQSSLRLSYDYPWLDIRAACVDYSQAWQAPLVPHTRRKVVFFPGSSIGNFEPDEAVALLSSVRKLCGQTGGLLIGFDCLKPAHILESAYNDAAGVTAEFNRNILHHLNRKLGADFNVERFAHKAFFNQQEGRIEMHLVSLDKQEVHLGEATFHFDKQETIHTESSYKYDPDQFSELLARAGFVLRQLWTDEKNWFAVAYAEPEA
jgi:dimethylhistidine N-methyltransferase